jgi:ornithine carbamoyltransferase
MKQLRHLVSMDDLSEYEIVGIVRLAQTLRDEWHAGIARKTLSSQTLAMIFEKPSLRTRVTFEAGMTQLGGHAIYLAPADIQVGKRESVADVARNLSRWVHGIMARTFAHDTVAGLAQYATIPVVNALSDYEHPCQALALAQTIADKRDLRGTHVVFVGDGNNVAHSIMLLCAKTGMRFTISCPSGYEPAEDIRRRCLALGGRCDIVRDPKIAVGDADVIYTDVWASMGQEEETEKRRADFAAYQVNSALLASAPKTALISHCLPAHRGEEITDEALDCPQSVAFDEAENRLHAQKAVLLFLLGGEGFDV